MQVKYSPGKKEDIDGICCMVRDAIVEMKSHHIFQWDEIYPARADFLKDIHRGELWVGTTYGDLCVVYTVNELWNPEYQNGDWRYTDCAYWIEYSKNSFGLVLYTCCGYTDGNCRLEKQH